jgi:hypothetical protein
VRLLDRPGLFKAKPTGWSVQLLPSGDPLVRVEFECNQVLEGETWQRIDPKMTRGDFFLVSRTGAPNEKVVEMLCCMLGWGGSFAQIHDGPPPQQNAVQVEVEGRDYKGKTYYQVQWIRPEDAEARGGGVSPEKAHALDKKYGKDFAAIAKKCAKPTPKGGSSTDDMDLSSVPF